jgi:hypothetical protein
LLAVVNGGVYTRRMQALRRIVGSVIAPRKEWAEIVREESSFDILVRHYIVPLSLLAPVTSLIGMKVFDAAWHEGSGYHVPPQEIFAAAATARFASLVSVFVLAGIFVLIAPMFDSVTIAKR